MLTALIAYVSGIFTVFAVIFARRRGASARQSPLRGPAVTRGRSPRANPVLGRSARVQLDSFVTDFGEDLANLSFEPAVEGNTAAAMAAYRRALDSYEKAKEALLGNHTHLARKSLDEGREALAELSNITQEAAELDGFVEEFWGDLNRLSFDPGEPGAPPESVRDYRRAVDSYEKAKEALLGEHTDFKLARQSLSVGRNALLRLDARIHRRPVPIDTSLVARQRGAADPPQPQQSKRFAYSGSTEKEYIFPIDWPQPGTPAILELTQDTDAYVSVYKCIFTDQFTDSRGSSVGLGGPGMSRFYLTRQPRIPTHLKISSSSPKKGTWHVRLIGLDDIPELQREYQGTGTDVLTLRSGTNVRLGAHVDTDIWRVTYFCRKKHRCSSPWSLGYMSYDDETMSVCGDGVIAVDAKPGVAWSLTVIPPTPRARRVGGKT